MCPKCAGFVIPDESERFAWRCVNCGKRGEATATEEEWQALQRWTARDEVEQAQWWEAFWRNRRLARQG